MGEPSAQFGDAAEGDQGAGAAPSPPSEVQPSAADEMAAAALRNAWWQTCSNNWGLSMLGTLNDRDTDLSSPKARAGAAAACMDQMVCAGAASDRIADQLAAERLMDERGISCRNGKPVPRGPGLPIS